MSDDRKKELLDIVVLLVLAIISCFVGRLIIHECGYTFWIFNAGTCGMLLIGELIWSILKKWIFR